MRTHRRSLQWLIGLLIALLITPAMAAQTKVEWSEKRVTLDVQQGNRVMHQLTFTVDRETGPVDVEAVPSISDFVKVTPERFESLEPGTSHSVQLVIAPTTETRTGVHGGTVHLRIGNSTAPDTLKVKINVKEDASDEGYVSPGEITLTGVSVDAFNATFSTIGFSLSGAAFAANPEEIQVYHQGWPVPDSDITLSSNLITVAPRLTAGRNEIILVANDTDGKLLYEEYILWAGNRTLSGYVVDENYQTVTNANVVIKLGDDQTVTAQTVTANGQFAFTNLPARTVILEASAADLRIGSVAANGAEGFVYLPTRGFYDPSPIANNDFTQGLAGWETGSSPVWLIPHEEEAQAQTLSVQSVETVAVESTDSGAMSLASSSTGSASPSRADLHQSLSKLPVTSAPTVTTQSFGIMSLTQQDMDLVLATSGQGPRSISRTFNTSPGTRNVTVRYRFITTEVPGGYYGTKYNDYFNVSIRSGSDGTLIESNSMNGLGLGAFDAAGRTAWRENSLTVNPDGDTVQVDLTVANVADGWLDSYLVVDLIEEKSLAITSMELNDIDNSALAYLSASTHPYFGGNTRIHGTVTVEGAADDALESLQLEVIQNGQVAATAMLDAGAESALLQTFGDDNTVSISASQLLFNLVPQNINVTNNGTLSLRARARAQSGEETTHDLGTVQILRRFNSADRYGGRDEAEGGDDWAKPSVAGFVESWSGMLWGDFSNMNGGRFIGHASHRTGNDADGWFSGYNALDANTAATIIGHLNQANASRITSVFVTYQAQAGNAFYDAIQNVTLNDGRRATDVIRPVAHHTTHFHWRIAD